MKNGTPQENPGAITLKQIAALAGVSSATVSRVLHTPHVVREVTRTRVLKVIEDYGYIYNKSAADFTSRKSTIIGMIIPTMRSSIHATLVQGIQDELMETGYNLIMGNTNYSLEMELDILQLFMERRVAGIVQAGINSSESWSMLDDALRHGIPSVAVWEYVRGKSVGCVGIDNYRAARTMTEYLIDIGHRRIGLLLGPFSRIERIHRRLDGYKAALTENAIPVDPTLIIEKEHTLLDGSEGMNRLLALSDVPSAVFAGSDVLAIGALAAIKRAGLRVPEDISVAGFDDIDFANFSDPPLTTVRVPAYEMGRRAIRMLIRLIHEPSRDFESYCLDTDLVLRQTCRRRAKS